VGEERRGRDRVLQKEAELSAVLPSGEHPASRGSPPCPSRRNWRKNYRFSIARERREIVPLADFPCIFAN